MSQRNTLFLRLLQRCENSRAEGRGMSDEARGAGAEDQRREQRSSRCVRLSVCQISQKHRLRQNRCPSSIRTPLFSDLSSETRDRLLEESLQQGLCVQQGLSNVDSLTRLYAPGPSEKLKQSCGVGELMPTDRNTTIFVLVLFCDGVKTLSPIFIFRDDV